MDDSELYSTGGAVAGGVAGAYLGGPAGAMIGAGVGGSIGGMLAPKKKYKSPNFSDIDLARDNPALYAQMQRYSELGKALEAEYNQRVTGATLQEQRAREQQLADMRSSLAARGSLGGSTELLAGQDINRNFANDVSQNIRAQGASIMQQRLAQKAAEYDMYRQAQGDIMNKLTQEAMQNWQDKQAEDRARNQFFTGLMQGGSQLYGANQQSAAMARNTAAAKAQSDAYYNGVPTYQAAPVVYQQPVMYQQAPVYQPAPSYQFGQYSPYYRRY